MSELTRIPRRPRALSRGVTLTLLVVGVAVLVLSAVGVLAIIQPAAPSQVDSSVSVESVPVETSTYSDARTVDVTATTTSGGDVLSPVSGFVTGSNCVPGATISSGSVMLAVNNVGLIALATSGPLWRDLESGDEGADVSALQGELARLGYSVGVDGTVGSQTLRAAKQLGTSAGVDTSDWQNVPRSAFIWIPSAQTTIESCATSIGAAVTDGQALAKLPNVLVRFAVKQLPGDLTPGARALVWAERTMPLGDAGEITSPDDLAAVQASPTFIAWLTAPDQPLPSGSLQLAQPLTVLTVPPSALSVIDNSTGCVFDGGTVIPVTIVGSSLGRTLVSVSSGETPSTVDTNGQNRSCG